MTDAWQAKEEARRAWMAENSLYLAEDEHSSCGVGLVVALNGKPSRRVVQAGIDALKAIWHRGAVDADGKTGDGAGIHVQIPVPFFYDQIRRTGHEPDMSKLVAVGQVFLPRTDFGAQERCRTIVETEVLRMGHYIYGWRHVPVNTDVLGEKANATRPEIEQILIRCEKDIDAETFERELYIIRRRIEKAAVAQQIAGLYLCTLSCRSIIYKGMMLAEQVAVFYPDLQDERFESAFAIYHQRYSTNTFPQWWLAQPFRMLAHNGEINTLKGNVNWMRSHEIRMASAAFGESAEDIKPIIPGGTSDSGALDAVFEVLVRGGRNAPMVKTMLVPEAWSKATTNMPKAWADMYAYCNAVMEPWDGPAALAMTDGRWVCGGLDRNGLRPMRYVVTGEGLLIAGSEAGMVPVNEATAVEKGALGPGQIIAVDMAEGRLYHDREIKDLLAASAPFGDWVEKVIDLNEMMHDLPEKALHEGAELRRRQIAAGYTLEDLEQILAPMAEDGKEAIASMGDDTPPAVLSRVYRPLSHYFRQNFSQVTNPPIDSLREERVMSLKTRFGNLKNVLDQDSSQTEILVLESPFIANGEFDELLRQFGEGVGFIDCTFPAGAGHDALRLHLERIRGEAEDAVRSGAAHLVLTDQPQSEGRVGMPMILATSAVHSWLTRKGLRTFCSLNVRSAECIDPHYFAVLVGSGATTVNPYLAEDSIADRIARGLLEINLTEAMRNYRHAIDHGLLKIMAKMGISVISSYRGGLNFEAVGLSRAMVSDYFPGMHSRISGIGVAGIQHKVEEIHAKGWLSGTDVLPVGGFYKARRSGEKHAWEAQTMHMLQSACDRASYEMWKQYSAAMRSNPPIHIRDLLDIKPLGKPIPIEEVESITSIRKRFVTPGMSLGALGPEAHKTLNVAMNRIGAKSDSGEGGEDPAHFNPEPNGDNPSAKIKQVASGRFGVTAEYLNQCREIEIKVAQGAKPGEGGQLPGFKVTEFIGRLRHAVPGTTLISPPPHHDIYSIEDLAQLIYDLKAINPDAKVTVKLVSASGIGAIASGVAKAKADAILIAGHNGGTGASPQTSIKHAGLPWEIGLAEAHQVLTLNNLRDSVSLRADGGLRTGRDVVIAALLGAEEYGLGTTALIAMGCLMVRQCHSNTCPVGVCSQDERLREKFTGTPDKVVNLVTFIAEEVREILASLGARTLDEIIGRTDLLRQVRRGGSHLDDLDLNPLLVQVEAGSAGRLSDKGRRPVPESLDARVLRDAVRFLDRGQTLELSYVLNNTQRTVGAAVSSAIVRRFGAQGPAGRLRLQLEGVSGQSFGAFAARGLELHLTGEANDYVGKGLSGADISIRTPDWREGQLICGNTTLYGATSGRLFVAGMAGERFAVRNSGAEAVVEGLGAHGCEYMTGGRVAVLGPVGWNLAAGMSGGELFVLEADGRTRAALNGDLAGLAPMDDEAAMRLRALIEAHGAATASPLARRLLGDWANTVRRFVRILPHTAIARPAERLKTSA